MTEPTIPCPQCMAWPTPRADCPWCSGTGQVCSRCRGAGQIVQRQGDSGPRLVPCSCVIRRKHVARYQDNRRGHWQECSFDNFDAAARPGVVSAFNATVLQARAIRNSYRDQQLLTAPLLVLVGPAGSGKSHLAAALVNWCVGQGLDGMFWIAPSLFDHLRAGFDDPQGDTSQARLAAMCTVPVLALVDLGILKFSSWTEEKLYQIIGTRTAERRATVITCHRQLTELPEILDAQLAQPHVSQVVYTTLALVDKEE
ncbi:MAG: ATP-binding protein [Chloroflexi bacterium]|nr:ATP-binding protein [Chloroflexota bacterium]MBU1748183.1 ATP-binding protein [Chloroflexota bacterium]MBU1877560.1 ATP-binding protein [Chloroflexota bacterium]